MFYSDLDKVIKAITNKIEEKQSTTITSGSQQSCSTYLTIGEMAVRISDHRATSNQISDVDYFLAMEIDGKLIVADDSLVVKKAYETLETIFDEDGEEVSTDWVDCDKHDEDAEHAGYRVSDEEIERVSENIISAANEFGER